MKIAISSTGKDLDSEIDSRFGRCRYLVFVDAESMDFEVVDNEGSMASGGAGVQAAQQVAERGATVLVTGNLGPNAASALSSAGVKVHLAPGGTVREVAKLFKEGKLTEINGPSVRSHFGAGGGRKKPLAT